MTLLDSAQRASLVAIKDIWHTAQWTTGSVVECHPTQCTNQSLLLCNVPAVTFIDPESPFPLERRRRIGVEFSQRQTLET
jgi:hypothetical protein